MRTLLLSALLWAPVAVAAPARGHVSNALAQATPAPSQSPSSAADDEDEDDAPAPTPPASPTPEGAGAKPAPSPAASTGAAAATPSTTGTNTTTAEQQELVSGAPLYNPNVAVHIVEKKQFSDRLRSELVLYPAAAQVNGKFTQHFGSAASYTFHLQENFGFQVSGIYNWSTQESGFNRELADRVSQAARAATSLFLVWGVHGGVEVTPLYGKFAFYDGSLAHFSFVVNGGAGAGNTKVQLKPQSAATGAATFGNTGVKFLGEVGAGFRLQLGNRFTLRLEVRDLVYTARVDSVNGCNNTDLQTLSGNINAQVSDGCKVSDFNPDSPGTDVGFATTLVNDLSSDVLNNVGFYAGFGIIF